MEICIAIISIYIGLYYPPLAIAIMLLAIEKIGIVPIIIYAFVISGVYWVKNNLREMIEVGVESRKKSR